MLVCPTYNKVVDILHVCFVYILIPQFLTDSPVNSLLFEVGNLHVRFGTLGARGRDDFWNIWVGEGSQCIGHDGWLTAIAVGFPKVMLRLLHLPGKLAQGSHTKVEYVIFQFTAPTLEFGIGFGNWTLGFGLSLLTSALLGLGCLPLVFCQSSYLTHLLQVVRMVYF